FCLQFVLEEMAMKWGSLLFLGVWLLAGHVAALELRGNWQQGGVIVGKLPEGSQVEYRGKKLQLSEEREFVIGLGRDAPAKAQLTVIDAQGTRVDHEFAVKQRQYNIQKVTGVPQQTVE